jgi:endoplasmic reticulum-Golgi intermediate compartment protein 3
VDADYTIKTNGSSLLPVLAYCLIGIFVFAEGISWIYQNQETVNHISVDTSLGLKMRVNMNITFPALACEDLHVDVMDVAGDSQVDIEDTLVKFRLNRYGQRIGSDLLKAESNEHQLKQEQRALILKSQLPEDYCGPCYGAAQNIDHCCNTCDDLLDAYKANKWRSDIVQMTAEQCIREGRHKAEPKKMKIGEGCNLSGYLKLNRVAGNFHIAMGEGIERDGRHIHTFNPDDTHNFNASHVIHDLSFGPSGTLVGFGTEAHRTLNGMSKMVTRAHGMTGLFQYFIKVVPTTYSNVNGDKVETNGYYFTERFRPLMKDYLEEEDIDEEDPDKVAVSAGHAQGGHAKHQHHNVRNAVLPGVFFIYEIYPFAVEIRRNSVPISHLLIRLTAIVGGVITMLKWADAYLCSRADNSSRR